MINIDFSVGLGLLQDAHVCSSTKPCDLIIWYPTHKHTNQSWWDEPLSVHLTRIPSPPFFPLLWWINGTVPPYSVYPDNGVNGSSPLGPIHPELKWGGLKMDSSRQEPHLLRVGLLPPPPLKIQIQYINRAPCPPPPPNTDKHTPQQGHFRLGIHDWLLALLETLLPSSLSYTVLPSSLVRIHSTALRSFLIFTIHSTAFRQWRNHTVSHVLQGHDATQELTGTITQSVNVTF